jgi:hypothetical protein
MSQVNDVTTTSPLPFPTRRSASDVPAAYAVSANGWVPVIDHPNRTTAYVRAERYPRKVKTTAAEATAYAAKVIAWREHFEGFKRRRREATMHPRYFLQAAE